MAGARRDASPVRRLGRTRPFRGANRKVVPGSIAEVEYLRIGEVDQWVMMRGTSRANPPLILLYGGPGMPETGFFRFFNAPLEDVFTVVYWEQRGSGKSFARSIPKSSMTVEQFVADLDELVELARNHTGSAKVAILGHSWGSALGVLYCERFPEKVAAYVGVAQIGDWPAAEASSYAFALSEAQRLRDRKAMRKLRAIGPPPYDAKSVFVERTLLQRLDGRLNTATLWTMVRILGATEVSIVDLPDLVRGFWFTFDAMWPETSVLNLVDRVPALQMPVFFFLGRKDHFVPPETSVAYYEALTAPSKRLVWFDESGHEIFADEPAKFNASMVGLVSPVVRREREEQAA
jgi:pimeloyl-ACP methyl ester carboxylesterase